MMNSRALLNQIQHDIVTAKLMEENLLRLMDISIKYQDSAPTDDYYNTMMIVENMKDINESIEEQLIEIYTRRTALNRASVEESDKVVAQVEEKCNVI